MFLNLIKLLLSRAVERLTDLVSPSRLIEATLADPAYRKSMESVTRSLAYSDIAAEIDLGELAGNLDYSDLAGNIDYGELAGNLDLDFGELAGNLDLDYGELAGNIDLGELAGNLDLDYGELAGHLDFKDFARSGYLDYSSLAGNIDYANLAAEIDYDAIPYEEIVKHVSTVIDYDRLAALCRGTDMFREQVALASPKVATEPVALDLRGSGLVEIDVARPGLVEKLLDLAVERLLALADEAAKEGKL